MFRHVLPTDHSLLAQRLEEGELRLRLWKHVRISDKTGGMYIGLVTCRRCGTRFNPLDGLSLTWGTQTCSLCKEANRLHHAVIKAEKHAADSNATDGTVTEFVESFLFGDRRQQLIFERLREGRPEVPESEQGWPGCQ